MNLRPGGEPRRHLEPAIGDLNQAIGLSLATAETWNSRGLALFYRAIADSGRGFDPRPSFEAARASLDGALRLDPRYALAHANLGLVFDASGRPADAIEQLERALALDPSLPHRRILLALRVRFVDKSSR